MIFFLISFFVGYCHIKCENAAKTANLLIRSGIHYYYSLHTEGDNACFSVFGISRKRVVKMLSQNNIEIISQTGKGVPELLKRYRLRFGAFIGIFAWIFICFASQNFLWEIKVVGNENVTDGEILEKLASLGVYEGTYIPGIDVLSAANTYVMKSDNIAWMGINLTGNHAEIFVVEYTARSASEQSHPSNMIATESGLIEFVEVTSGEAAVKVGDVVTKGQLLISGLTLLRNGKMHFGSAGGKIIAQTVRQKDIEIPLKNTKKTYTDNIVEQKSLIFFTKHIKLYKDTGNLPPTCDRIENKERIMLFGKIPLPLWKRIVRYCEYENTEVSISEEEAKKLAENRLNSDLSEYDILSRRQTYSFNGDTVKITCTFRCREDIASEIPLFSDD